MNRDAGGAYWADASIPLKAMLHAENVEMLGVMLGIELAKICGIGTFVLECDSSNVAQKENSL